MYRANNSWIESDISNRARNGETPIAYQKLPGFGGSRMRTISPNGTSSYYKKNRQTNNTWQPLSNGDDFNREFVKNNQNGIDNYMNLGGNWHNANSVEQDEKFGGLTSKLDNKNYRSMPNNTYQEWNPVAGAPKLQSKNGSSSSTAVSVQIGGPSAIKNSTEPMENKEQTPQEKHQAHLDSWATFNNIFNQKNTPAQGWLNSKMGLNDVGGKKQKARNDAIDAIHNDPLLSGGEKMNKLAEINRLAPQKVYRNKNRLMRIGAAVGGGALSGVFRGLKEGIL